MTLTSTVLVKISYILGLSLTILSLILLFFILGLHYYSQSKDKRREAFYQKWRPILRQAVSELPETIPKVKKIHWIDFITIWNYYQEIIKAQGNENLNYVAQQVGLGSFVRKILFKKNMGIGPRLSALSALSHLRDIKYWDDILPITFDQNSTLSLAAVGTLLSIDPVKGIPIFLNHLNQRNNWPPYKVVILFSKLNPELLAKPLVEKIFELKNSQRLPNFIRYLRFVDNKTALQVVRPILEKEDNDLEVISACLQVIENMATPHDLPIVRKYLISPQWFIRIKAIQVLASMGTTEDEKYLLQMLSDREWWVRYRAAQALFSLPHITKEKIINLRDNQLDRFARDILEQVLVERRYKLW